MGGYGAVKLALKFPDQFCSAVGHSGCYAIAKRNPIEDSDAERRRIFGDKPEGGPDDPFALAEKIDRAKLPEIRFDCGTEDFLLDHNREFHAYLDKLGIPHEYEEFPGTHEWGFWDTHVQQALAFHCKALGI